MKYYIYYLSILVRFGRTLYDTDRDVNILILVVLIIGI